MLQNGVIKGSTSPWSNPIVVVPKPDGTLILSNDFRNRKVVSDLDSFPMPRVDDLVNCLGKACFISLLDLTEGYWQVPLTPEIWPKTAFSIT